MERQKDGTAPRGGGVEGGGIWISEDFGGRGGQKGYIVPFLRTVAHGDDRKRVKEELDTTSNSKFLFFQNVRKFWGGDVCLEN